MLPATPSDTSLFEAVPAAAASAAVQAVSRPLLAASVDGTSARGSASLDATQTARRSTGSSQRRAQTVLSMLTLGVSHAGRDPEATPWTEEAQVDGEGARTEDGTAAAAASAAAAAAAAVVDSLGAPGGAGDVTPQSVWTRLWEMQWLPGRRLEPGALPSPASLPHAASLPRTASLTQTDSLPQSASAAPSGQEQPAAREAAFDLERQAGTAADGAVGPRQRRRPTGAAAATAADDGAEVDGHERDA